MRNIFSLYLNLSSFLKNVIKYDIKSRTFEIVSQLENDIEMSSECLHFLLKNKWGRGTVLISGRCQINYEKANNFFNQTNKTFHLQNYTNYTEISKNNSTNVSIFDLVPSPSSSTTTIATPSTTSATTPSTAITTTPSPDIITTPSSIIMTTPSSTYETTTPNPIPAPSPTHDIDNIDNKNFYYKTNSFRSFSLFWKYMNFYRFWSPFWNHFGMLLALIFLSWQRNP